MLPLHEIVNALTKLKTLEKLVIRDPLIRMSPHLCKALNNLVKSIKSFSLIELDIESYEDFIE
jgi:hypothetical protein